MNPVFKAALLLVMITTISACGGPFAEYSNAALKLEFQKCDYQSLSPAGAQRCLNIEKECKKRFDDDGFRC